MPTITTRGRDTIVIRFFVAGAIGLRPGELHAICREFGIIPERYIRRAA